MNVSRILNATEAHLKPKVEQIKGKLSIARDPEHAVEMLGQSSTRWRLVMGWDGYDNYDDEPFPNSGLSWVRFVFLIERNQGMAAKPGSDLPEMFNLIDDVMKWVRGIRFNDGVLEECQGFQLLDSNWVQTEEYCAFRRHQLRFRLLLAADAATIAPVAL
jgi:hypothetical protein